MKVPSNEYNPYYEPYIAISTNGDSISHSLAQNQISVPEFYKQIPKEKHDYAYAEGKWTVKDILLHLIDTERIFSYRAMRIARQDKVELAGFEQDDYVIAGKASKRSLNSLIEEYKAVRHATITMFKTFSDKELESMGTASGSQISVRAIGHIITGHENHHNTVIKQRYL